LRGAPSKYVNYCCIHPPQGDRIHFSTIGQETPRQVGCGVALVLAAAALRNFRVATGMPDSTTREIKYSRPHPSSRENGRLTELVETGKAGRWAMFGAQGRTKTRTSRRFEAGGIRLALRAGRPHRLNAPDRPHLESSYGPRVRRIFSLLLDRDFAF